MGPRFLFVLFISNFSHLNFFLKIELDLKFKRLLILHEKLVSTFFQAENVVVKLCNMLVFFFKL